MSGRIVVRWTHYLVCLCFIVLPRLTAAAEPDPSTIELVLPGEVFVLEKRLAFVMLPKPAARSNPQPWILYAPTLLPTYPDLHEKWMHEQFLNAGIAIAGIDVGEAYGSPRGCELCSALYRELTENRQFARKPCLLGRSRGGLWTSSWAIANPDKVAGLVGIYPVYDFRTYPGLAQAAPAYDLPLNEFTARAAEFNPIERVHLLAQAKIPVAIIHGALDELVPLKSNSGELQRRYEAAGAGDLVQLIVVPDQGHNYFEGFFRSQPLVDFAIERAKRK